MAVPDTNTFSLQDVVNEVNPTTNDLQDCINDAANGQYDSTYYTAPATSLLEFRNYGAGSGTTQFTIDTRPEFTSPDACAIVFNPSFTENRWHNGSSIYPVTGDTVYINGGGTNPWNGSSVWWAIVGSSIVIQVNSSGLVIDHLDCNLA